MCFGGRLAWSHLGEEPLGNTWGGARCALPGAQSPPNLHGGSVSSHLPSAQLGTPSSSSWGCGQAQGGIQELWAEVVRGD